MSLPLPLLDLLLFPFGRRGVLSLAEAPGGSGPGIVAGR